MGKGSTTIQQPDPINYAKEAFEYMYGPGTYEGSGGMTDPLFNERLIQSESAFRPRYTALELQDVGTMLSGVEEGSANPAYSQLQDQISNLKSGGGEDESDEDKELRASKISELEKTLESIPETLSKTKGLNELLSDSAKASGITQRGELALQRADDLTSFQDLAPQFVEAYRKADPFSRDLADAASLRAGVETGIGTKGSELLNSELQSASAAEQALQGRGMSDVNARLEDASASEQALEARGLSDINASREAASQAERQLQQMGMSLGDLSPTEQEALLSGRGSEFLKSTGELTPLEQRRAQQSARQASLARGREMGQGAAYGEMQARMAEELNKQQREIALGSQLIGQEASMRGARLGQGAGMLQGSEVLANQRRDAQLQRQMFGAQNLGQVDNMAARRTQEQLQRQMFGTQTLGQSEALAAQRRKELMQRQQMGAGLIQGEDAIQSGRFGQAFGMNRSMAGDLGSAVLGRPSSAVQLGQQTLGQAQQGAAGQMGAQLFDSNMGINLAMQDRQNEFNLLGTQAQIDAQSNANGLGLAGTVIGAMCWVAREVYGEQDPRWVQFRTWMLCESPSWFRKLYVRFGERFAKFISNKPKIKNIIRGWMNNRIK